MSLDYSTLEYLRQNNPAWRLLRSDHAALVTSFLQRVLGIGTSFLLKKVSKIPKVKNITVPLIQAQHVVLVSGERILSQGKNQSPKI
jgi:cellobiose-specific phosphotransferase system component IIB